MHGSLRRARNHRRSSSEVQLPSAASLGSHHSATTQLRSSNSAASSPFSPVLMPASSTSRSPTLAASPTEWNDISSSSSSSSSPMTSRGSSARTRPSTKSPTRSRSPPSSPPLLRPPFLLYNYVDREVGTGTFCQKVTRTTPRKRSSRKSKMASSHTGSSSHARKQQDDVDVVRKCEALIKRRPNFLDPYVLLIHRLGQQGRVEHVARLLQQCRRRFTHQSKLFSVLESMYCLPAAPKAFKANPYAGKVYSEKLPMPGKPRSPPARPVPPRLHRRSKSMHDMNATAGYSLKNKSALMRTTARSPRSPTLDPAPRPMFGRPYASLVRSRSTGAMDSLGLSTTGSTSEDSPSDDQVDHQHQKRASPPVPEVAPSSATDEPDDTPVEEEAQEEPAPVDVQPVAAAPKQQVANKKRAWTVVEEVVHGKPALHARMEQRSPSDCTHTPVSASGSVSTVVLPPALEAPTTSAAAQPTTAANKPPRSPANDQREAKEKRSSGPSTVFVIPAHISAQPATKTSSSLEVDSAAEEMVSSSDDDDEHIADAADDGIDLRVSSSLSSSPYPRIAPMSPLPEEDEAEISVSLNESTDDTPTEFVSSLGRPPRSPHQPVGKRPALAHGGRRAIRSFHAASDKPTSPTPTAAPPSVSSSSPPRSPSRKGFASVSLFSGSRPVPQRRKRADSLPAVSRSALPPLPRRTGDTSTAPSRRPADFESFNSSHQYRMKQVLQQQRIQPHWFQEELVPTDKGVVVQTGPVKYSNTRRKGRYFAHA